MHLSWVTTILCSLLLQVLLPFSVQHPHTHPPFPPRQMLAWTLHQRAVQWNTVRHCVEAKTWQLPYLMETTGHDWSGKLLQPHSYREKLGHFLPLIKASSDGYGKNQLLYSVLSPRLGIPGDKVSPQQDRHTEISASHCVTNLWDLLGVVYHRLRIWINFCQEEKSFQATADKRSNEKHQDNCPWNSCKKASVKKIFRGCLPKSSLQEELVFKRKWNRSTFRE